MNAVSVHLVHRWQEEHVTVRRSSYGSLISPVKKPHCLEKGAPMNRQYMQEHVHKNTSFSNTQESNAHWHMHTYPLL